MNIIGREQTKDSRSLLFFSHKLPYSPCIALVILILESSDFQSLVTFNSIEYSILLNIQLQYLLNSLQVKNCLYRWNLCIGIGIGVSVKKSVTPIATAPVAVAPLSQPTGNAVSTETRNPDGSVITVTRFNGQIPHHIFQQQFPGFWSPYGQYGLFRPPFYHIWRMTSWPSPSEWPSS